MSGALSFLATAILALFAIDLALFTLFAAAGLIGLAVGEARDALRRARRKRGNR